MLPLAERSAATWRYGVARCKLLRAAFLFFAVIAVTLVAFYRTSQPDRPTTRSAKNGTSLPIEFASTIINDNVKRNNSATTAMAAAAGNKAIGGKQGVILSVDFKGGIGNQLFMYAALAGIAEELGFDARIPDTLPVRSMFNLTLNTIPDQWEATNRPVMLMEGKKFGSRDESLLFHLSELRGIGKGRKWKGREGKRKGSDAVIYGYLQSWTYFSNISERLRRELTFRDEIGDEAARILRACRRGNDGSPLVGIHVRRGDLQALHSEGYRTGDVDFFRRAIAHFRGGDQDGGPTPTPTFVVASDDVQWCVENLQNLHPSIVFLTGNTAAVDMSVISQCDHVIYDVGSYGWWCGWLSSGQVLYMENFAERDSKIARGTIREEYFLPQWLGL
ncbi:PREDICTED: galactoside 2-alpha-L-fucosyltransferase 1-like [Priapulus caudatus]|uniref:L-Fucosyltransferase n=1 Tax=Priapulus caudatus TaxID=37621 RepID=A0ABM1F4G4_PRICU|nr:PREDICTED: galactoside 2-alpha-L-fucosyltransferase 1-like [Priapulus caudatus]